MIRLNALQEFLQRVYGLYLEHRVEDFLVTDPDLARELDRSRNPRQIKEKLLVLQEDDELAIALYLDRSVVEKLTEDQSTGILHHGNIGEFLLALEGISHFVCLVWNAGRRRSVSLLELEMQAEIDKFIALSSLMAGQRAHLEPKSLRKWLFDEPRFDESLDDEQRQRYMDANHFAGKYCCHLERRHWKKGPQRLGHELLGDLRRFYRLSQAEKISLIHREYVPAI
jgi:hypothetical protein